MLILAVVFLSITTCAGSCLEAMVLCDATYVMDTGSDLNKISRTVARSRV